MELQISHHHNLSCPRRAFPTNSHNEIRNLLFRPSLEVREKSLQHRIYSWGWTWVLHQEVLCSLPLEAWEYRHQTTTDWPCSGWEVSSPTICHNDGVVVSCHSFVFCHQSCVSMALDQNKIAFMYFLHPSVWLLVNHASCCLVCIFYYHVGFLYVMCAIGCVIQKL